MQIVSEAFPSHNLLGEETGFQNKNSEYTWVVDPIDGTSNFAAGLPWFGVIICVMKDFKPEIAGCFLPVQNQMYFAKKDKGASLNGKPISVSKESELKNILVAYSLDYSDEPGKTETEVQIIKRLVEHVRNLRSANCLLDLCFTADGKLGACINQTTKIWDIAGPGLIIEEAGGKVSDLNGNACDYSVNESNYDRNFKIVGSNKVLHPKVIEIIN
jgi:myo-inositol-1(or 4)-monophosphatase